MRVLKGKMGTNQNWDLPIYFHWENGFGSLRKILRFLNKNRLGNRIAVGKWNV